MLKLAHGRTRVHIQFLFIHGAGFEDFDLGREHAFIFIIIADPGPRRALDQHLDGAVRQFQELQDIGQGADAIGLIRAGVVFRRAFLRDQQDLFVALHGAVQRAHRFLPADKQRDDHVRIHHDIAQGQDWVGFCGLGHAL